MMKEADGSIFFQINQRLNSKQTRVIHAKAPVSLMLCIICVILIATKLNLVHLIFIKTRKSGAFLKNGSTKSTMKKNMQSLIAS